MNDVWVLLEQRLAAIRRSLSARSDLLEELLLDAVGEGVDQGELNEFGDHVDEVSEGDLVESLDLGPVRGRWRRTDSLVSTGWNG
jgi:hypothetical protein